MAARFGLWAAIAAFAASVAYGIPQILQVAGVLQDPWDRILIFTPSLALAPAFVLTMAALHEMTPLDRRVLSLSALALAENFDREDLTAYEIALAIRNAEANFPNRKSLAAALGINRTELYQYLAFFALPSFVIDDLEIAPALLGRDAAEDLATTIKRHGQQGIDSLQSMWPRFKAGEIDQGKVASLIESTLTRSQHVPTERDIRKLFVGKDQAGSIMRDASKLQVTIRSAALTSEKEAELRRFVESMFK